MHMAQDPDEDNDDGTFTYVDKYFAEHGYGDEFCGPPSQEPNPEKDDRDLAGTAEKPNCNRRRLAFGSQETPPAPFFLIACNGTEFCSQTGFLSVLGLIIFCTSAI